MPDLLAERAARFRDIILDVAMGPGGMIIDFVAFDTRRPFQEGIDHDAPYVAFIDDAWGEFTPRPTSAELWYGENTLWVTGWLLWSQMLRYRATQEPEALATARKCFRDLNNIFRLSSMIEPGLLGKPHGGRPGETTSFDQAACPVLMYVAFAQELATSDEKAEAVANMTLHGDYYLRRNWVMNHHGNLARVVDPCHTSTMKYLACVYAAYELSGETRFRDAVRHYLRQIIDSGKLPWPSNPYETNHNLFYWAFLCDYWSRSEMADEADWLGCIREYWQAARTALDGDGLLLFGQYDSSARSFTPYPERWLTREDAEAFPMQAPRRGRSERHWISSTSLPNRSQNASCAAALGLLARSHGFDDGAGAVAQRALLHLDEEMMRWWWDDGGLPDEVKPLANVFAPESAAIWLTAYWMGRLQKVW